MVGYMDEEEDDPGRRMRLIASIEGQCVNIRFDEMRALSDMATWCFEKIGSKRPYHPIHEAEEGWIDYFEGDWAADRIANDGDAVMSFWFARREDLLLFKLTWLGDAP
jgi:hypothetical protein